MRYVSQLFQPVITIPKNAKIKNTEVTCVSQKLLLELGLVRPTSSGLYALLPLARRALDKLEALARGCVEAAGAQRVGLPALTPAPLWERSGRASEELLAVRDRHEKKYLLAPTHEEAIADLLADVGPLSYKQLPLLLYQISSKYRDEARPKHGLLRAREFVMLDAYGAHGDVTCARAQYGRVRRAYSALFRRLRLPVYPVEAPCGEMGGSLSHEWQLPARAGEDVINVCASCSHASPAHICTSCGKETEKLNSIEVGHTFVLGTRYSEPLGAHFTPARGPAQPLIMSCYGIGLTRLLAASLEALSTGNCLRWPRAIAPYTTIIIGPKEGSREWSSAGWASVQAMVARLSRAQRADLLVDDRHHLSVGRRLLAADRMGYPTVVVCGKSLLESPPRAELHRRGPGTDPAGLLLPVTDLPAILGAGDDEGSEDDEELSHDEKVETNKI